MKPSTRFPTLASFSISICIIPSLVSAAYLHLPFSRQLRDLSNTILSRDSNPSLSLWGGDYVYVVNATVGTPGQSISLVLSPSGTDTWFPDKTSSSCNYSAYDYDYTADTYEPYNVTYSSYCLWGSFDKSTSSTYQRAQSGYRSWSAYQPDSTYVDGANFTDTLTIGDVKLENMYMGLADTSDQWIGSLGLGMNSSYYGGTYDNFPDRLVQAGTIKSKAYSIWLDAEDGSSGNLLMGAVDTSKYEGTLARLDAYGYGTVFYHAFGVDVLGINGSTSGSASDGTAFVTNELPFSASIGHGETFSNFPDPIAQKFWSLAGATYNASIDLATIPCDAATKATDGGPRFSFRLTGPKGPVLDVRLSDLILPQTVAASMWKTYTPATTAPPNSCLFAVQNGSAWGYGSSSSSWSSYEYYTIGAPLLRRSYMVFDIENREIAIAPVKFGASATESNIVPFESYGAYIPASTTYCISNCRGVNNSTNSGSDGGSSSGGGGSGSSSTGGRSQNIGLIAGLSVAFGLVTIIGLLGAFAVWRKVASKRTNTGHDSDAELADDGSVATEQTPVPSTRGPPAGPLPTVREEMAETTMDSPPQLAPLAAERGHGEGTHWPLQGSPSPGETASPSSEIHHDSMAGETPAPVDKGKGKEVARD
ncbi:aspartic peptidase domain-containing protein [Coniochaeta sp. 2T2.1]|nr:aspartic peptidase domain-containing protein [Coniochaeta sp. 2T2.1]